MNVGIVVARYGTTIDGGAETLAREVAERLAAEVTVEVFTTQAVDYLTWKNELPGGSSVENGVRVRRFPVVRPRRVRSFGRLSERLYHRPHTIEDELDWMIRQGPRAHALLEALRDDRERFDAVVFFSYLYYPTVFGLPLVAEKSVLVPTLHDEPPARFDVFRPVFHLPRAFVWNTPEERELAVRLFSVRPSGPVGGFGVDAPPDVDREAFARRYGLGPYVLYLGRIDVWKGIPELLDHFAAFRAAGGSLDLVLAGRQRMRLRASGPVRLVGFLSESEKWEALAGATAIVVPSCFESLSIVALESWAASTPVVATDKSSVLVGQCRRSGGGWTYTDARSFGDALEAAASPEGRTRGAMARRYVERECTWEAVLEAYRGAIREAAGR